MTAMRGAVSLALALSLAQDEMIDSAQGQQILFLSAGIVVLTILINGSTMEALLAWFGLDKLPPAKAATVDKAKNIINRKLANLLPKLSHNDFLQGADWRSIQRTVWMPTDGRRHTNPATDRSYETSISPFAIRHTSVDVPPISKDTAWSMDNDAA